MLKKDSHKFTNISEIVRHFQGKRIAVIGDIMLDRFLFGATDRISPEAPVPVIRIQEEIDMPGGAGNVAVNLTSLGVEATLFGVVGDDEAGKRTRSLLQAANVQTDGVFVDHERATIQKTRISALGQQIVRIDHEDTTEISERTAEFLSREFLKRVQKFDGVVFADYAKGVVTQEVVDNILLSIQDQDIPVILDTKQKNVEHFVGVTVITPNEKEAEIITGEHNPLQAGAVLRKKLGSAVLLTQSAKGMTVFLQDDTEHFMKARAKEVFDVSGAGDTVVATLAAVLSSGVSLIEAAEIANIAAGIAVGKRGTAHISCDEIISVCRESENTEYGVLDEKKLLHEIGKARDRGERVVFTNGCFDILHTGHVKCLERAKALGDRLVVAVNDDASVKRLKGEERPINTLYRRMEVLAGLRSVDWVVPFSEDTPHDIISKVLPDVLVKGGDYTPESVIGKEIVERNGGELVIIPLEKGHSTTAIIKSIQK